MPSQTIYPGADSRTQWFANAYPGNVMALSAPVLVLHTTEGGGWPAYQGGAVAPTFTIWPGHGVRQHFPVNMSARALVGEATAGVATNTAGAIQVELVGTCALGGPGLYWPAATDSDMAELVALTKWLHAAWGLKVQSSVTFRPYPSSYGLNAPQRLSKSAWLAYEGVLGHQHVPGNDHGDPGAFPIGRFLGLVAGTGLPGAPVAPPTTTTPAKEADMPLSDADIQKIAAAVWGAQMTDWNDHKPYPASSFLVGSRAATARIEGVTRALATKAPVTADEIKAAIESAQLRINADATVSMTAGGAA